MTILFILWPLLGIIAYAYLIRGRDEYTISDVLTVFPMLVLGPMIFVVVLCAILWELLVEYGDYPIWRRKK